MSVFLTPISFKPDSRLGTEHVGPVSIIAVAFVPLSTYEAMKFSKPVGFKSMMCKLLVSCLVCMKVHVGVCNSCEVIFILCQAEPVEIVVRVDAPSLLVSSTSVMLAMWRLRGKKLQKKKAFSPLYLLLSVVERVVRLKIVRVLVLTLPK